MVKNRIDINFKIKETIKNFQPAITYCTYRYNEWMFYRNNPQAIWYNKSIGILRPYYDLDREFQDILHAVKDIISDAFKSLHFVVEYYAFKRAGKMSLNKVFKTGLAVMKEEGMLDKNGTECLAI